MRLTERFGAVAGANAWLVARNHLEVKTKMGRVILVRIAAHRITIVPAFVCASMCLPPPLTC